MTNMRMTKEEQEAFLARNTLAVVGVPADGKAPILTPVMYRYDATEGMVFVCAPGGGKANRLNVGTPVTLNVQDGSVRFNEHYVSVEGEVSSIEPDEGNVELERLAKLFFGEEKAAIYMSFLPADFNLLKVTVRPTRWLSRDYTKAWGPQG